MSGDRFYVPRHAGGWWRSDSGFHPGPLLGPRAVIRITEADVHLLRHANLACVVLSRHTTLTLVAHDEAAFAQFESAWPVSGPVADALTTWVPGMEADTRVRHEADPELKQYLTCTEHAEQVPIDSHLPGCRGVHRPSTILGAEVRTQRAGTAP